MTDKAPAAKPETDHVQMAQIREFKRFAIALEGVTNLQSLVNMISEHALASRDILSKAKKAAAGAPVAKKVVAKAKPAQKKAVAKKPVKKAPAKKKAKKPVAAAPAEPAAAAG